MDKDRPREPREPREPRDYHRSGPSSQGGSYGGGYSGGYGGGDRSGFGGSCHTCGQSGASNQLMTLALFPLIVFVSS